MPKIPRVGTAYRHLHRYRQVAMVLIKYGFGDFLDRLRLWEHVNIERRIFRRSHNFAHLTHAERLRLSLEELGPTFVKLGQILSTRPDLVPHDFILELEKLQDQVAPIPTTAAKEIIQSELGRPVDEIFTSFDDQPLGSASLSQVHRATLKGGEVVAVKVQRPHVAEIIEADLEIMHHLAIMAERHLPEARLINLVGLITEFRTNIKKELDLRVEANNMRRFAHNFAGDPQIHVPALWPELCTRHVLVMEYIQGMNISETQRLIAEGYDLSLIASRGVDIALKSVFEHGFFHADPHPGNIFILPDNVICLLDYGMMGTISSHHRESLARLAITIAAGDEKATARALLGLAEAEEAVDVESLGVDLSDIIGQHVSLPLREVRLGDTLHQLLRLLTTHQLRFNMHLVWLFKAVATVEDTMHRLDTDFDMIERTKPYAMQMLKRRFVSLRQASELYFIVSDMFEFMKDLPYEARDVLRQLKKGRFKIEFEHAGLESIQRALKNSSNRLVLAIIIAALLISSSLIVHSGLPPRVADIPMIGLVGYIIAVVLSLLLIVSVLRSGRT
jgi:ubiquinone biosynthesis protein